MIAEQRNGNARRGRIARIPTGLPGADLATGGLFGPNINFERANQMRFLCATHLDPVRVSPSEATEVAARYECT